jgi:hypothetical protein
MCRLNWNVMKIYLTYFQKFLSVLCTWETFTIDKVMLIYEMLRKWICARFENSMIDSV